MRLYLVRHGQTPSNVGYFLDTLEPGPGLTELGHRQAAALPGVLGDAGIEAIWVSTLVRTHLTAAPLAQHLGMTPHVHAGLREISAGSLEMANDDASAQKYLSVAMAWAEGQVEVRMPGGEDGTEALGRFDAAIEEVAASGVGTAAVFSHGAMIRVWAGARTGQAGLDLAARAPLSNTGAVVLDGEPGAWRLEAWHAEALGGALLDDAATDGVAGEPVED
ncbi:histidine phosphatase family protein [Puerhibacterium puerhi]|uniref:histidine phosphatase family protein n=1 Tax=Puerhibacterium puerhi TaxID=2692623 RepID=UPI00135A6DA8|nr:histidine phosphatase family protein [Puerhibacterium puerhi]